MVFGYWIAVQDLNFIPLVTVFMQGFIKSFAEGDHPKIEKPKVMELYQYQGTVGCVCGLLLMAPIGYAVSKLSPKIWLPFAFLFRAMISILIFKIEDPSGI